MRKQIEMVELMKKKPKTLQEKLSDSHYQPSKAEMEKEYDMPQASMDSLRQAFFEPSDGAGRPKSD